MLGCFDPAAHDPVSCKENQVTHFRTHCGEIVSLKAFACDMFEHVWVLIKLKSGTAKFIKHEGTTTQSLISLLTVCLWHPGFG